MKRILLLCLIIIALAPPQPAEARVGKHDKPAKHDKTAVAKPDSGSLYRRAFNLLDTGHAQQAYELGRTGGDIVLNKVLKGYYMAQPGNDVTFTELSAFISDNPDWPNLRGIIAIAEQKLPSSTSNAEIVGWFRLHSPVTLTGFDRYISALSTSGDASVRNLVRERWINGDFNFSDLADFRQRYANYLNGEDDRTRMDRLLWKNDSVNARRMVFYVDDTAKAVMDARLAIANQNPNAEAFLSRVPRDGQNDPGLLYDRLRYNVRNNQDAQALDILQHAPDDLGKADAWWEPRQTEIRRALMQRDYTLAYNLSVAHGQTDNKTLIQGEFLAGWIALRFLNEPGRAITHFQNLYDNASTPMSRSRGAYWLGRSYEALNDKANAEQAYETAAALNTTYYGQLATARLYPNPVIEAKPEPKIPFQIRQNFFNRSIVRAVERLHDIGEDDRARAFFKAATEGATQRADFAMLTELAYEIGRPDLAIEAGKAASQKNMLMASGGFPVLNHNITAPPEPAFTHALIRQESMFNPNAHSPAGAHGLMQLMPRTAREVAQKLGIQFSESKLAEETYNLRLGTTFIQNQLAIFDGSYVLALAGYNAGPRHVRDWMQVIGDPRNPDVDTIDWIEMIPVSETRNYVQRILESLQIYRARLNGGQAPLMIINDLKR